jgi:hypothetical protein
MEDISKYKYLFVYIDEDKRVSSEFSAFINMEDLMENIRDFLCGCSWSEEKVNEYIKLEDK